MKNGTKSTICVYCGKTATRMNKWKQPVCSEHVIKGEKKRDCPECGATMVLRKGKFGYFWGCSAFPNCDKTLSIQQELDLDKDKKE